MSSDGPSSAAAPPDPAKRGLRASADPRGGLFRPMLAAAGVLIPLSVIEVLALASSRQWLSPRIWLMQAATAGLVLLVVAVFTGIAGAVARLLGWRLPGADVGFALAVLIVANAHLHNPFGMPFASPLPPRFLSLLDLGLLAAAIVAFKLLVVRYRLSYGETTVALITVMALPIGLLAINLAPIFGSAVTTAGGAVAAGAGIYLVLTAVAIVRGGRWRSLLLVGTTILGVIALRFGVANPHQLHVTAADAPAPGAGSPVLLIVLDTVRRDALDLGDPRSSSTPHLARLAGEADVYHTALANASWSLPGHASLFTGLPVSHHRTDWTTEPGFASRLPEVYPTAPEILAAHGYRTSCVTANGLISMRTGLARGCQRLQAAGAPWLLRTWALDMLVEATGWIRTGNRRHFVHELLPSLIGLNWQAEAREIVDAALDELTGDPEPLYLFLNFMDAHPPYTAAPGEPLAERAALLRDWSLFLLGQLDAKPIVKRHAATKRGRYHARVRRLDRELGRLFDILRSRGWYDRMLIVVTSDHGEALGDDADGGWGHHGSFEPVVRIPLIIKRPGQRAGRSWEHPVQQSDVLPALLALAGLPRPEGLPSRVLDPGVERPVFTEWYARKGGGPTPTRVALYRDAYKLVVEGDSERELLFELGGSPSEGLDIRSAEADLAADLRAELDTARRLAAAAASSLPETTDPDIDEALRALGYIN